MDELNITEILKYIPVSECSYQEWVNVGMALKLDGRDVSIWDNWSKNDSRYREGECAKKWNSFNGAAAPVTMGTVVQMAKERGYTPYDGGHALDWDAEISDEHVIVRKDWIEGREIQPPAEWQPEKQIIRYLETLFEQDENVGYIMQSYEKDGRYVPANKGSYDRTAGQLIEELSKCGGDIGAVLGDYNAAAGAWIRFNPLDGRGVKNENVTEYRYALVESDSTDIEKQNTIIRELELPVAALVYSGGKSIHAIVRIDAASYDEYRRRVDYLYNVCRKNGLDPDTQNKNPSRLSRLPGVVRGENKQYIIDTNIGKSGFKEWQEWIESANDDLPDAENMAAIWDDIPPLSPPLIDGVLRQGHKMLVAGPSKAGKSYLLIELCIAIASGGTWLGRQCAKGRVLYVNLELDRASCLHRFRDVYNILCREEKHLENIDIWNLRGRAVPMDKLAPRLIRRAAKKGYTAVVIDPIYKVITGDENSADQMSHFCNQFDKVCTELNCAVIYCHHHSKGFQGAKRSMDRASGSGVFARDPDALIDLIELELTEPVLKQQQDKAVIAYCSVWLKDKGLYGEVSQDDLCSAKAMYDICAAVLPDDKRAEFDERLNAVRRRAGNITAWRAEGTLREFPRLQPVNMWFDYPIHRADNSGVLKDIQAEGAYQANFAKKKTNKERKDDRKASLETAFDACAQNGRAKVSDIAEYMDVSEMTVRRHLKEHGDFWIEKNEAGKKQ